MKYSEKLRDPRWQKKRLEVLSAARFRCEDCGDGASTLEIHHCAYMTGRETWDYDGALLMALCRTCHCHRQQLEDSLRIDMGRITRFLKPEQVQDEAFRMVREMADRETDRLAESFTE